MSKKFLNFYVPGSGVDIWLQDVPESQDNLDSEMDERNEILLSSSENFYCIEMHLLKIQIMRSYERILASKNLI